MPVRVTSRAAEHRFGAGPVGGAGQLVEHRVAFDRRHLQAGGATTRVISSVGGVAGQLRIGVAQVLDVERLRGLDPDQRRRGRPSRRASPPPGQRVGDRQHRHRAVVVFQRLEQPVDDVRRAEGAGGVVDQDDARRRSPRGRRGRCRPARAPPTINVADVAAAERRARQRFLARRRSPRARASIARM